MTCSRETPTTPAVQGDNGDTYVYVCPLPAVGGQPPAVACGVRGHRPAVGHLDGFVASTQFDFWRLT